MTIFNELVERVSNGETFHIDFEKRTMKVGNGFLIKMENMILQGIYSVWKMILILRLTLFFK